MIVGPRPWRCDALNVVQIFLVILGQPFVANGSVEGLDIGILLRLAGQNVFKPDAPCRCSFDDGCAQILWTVIAANG